MGKEDGKTLLWALVGAMTGAGLALLLAPRSGEETRKVLKDYGQDFVDRAKSFQEELQHRLDQYLVEFEEYADRKAERGEELLNDMVKTLEKSRQRFHERVQRYRAES